MAEPAVATLEHHLDNNLLEPIDSTAEEKARARRREINVFSSRKYRAKMDPAALADFRRKNNERARELRNERRAVHPNAFADFKKKNNERARDLRAKQKKDPNAYAKLKRKERERMSELNAERMKDPVVYA